MNRQSESWDRRLLRRLDWHREVIAAFTFGIIIGFFAGAFFVMTKHHHQIISLLEQTK